MGRRTKDLRVLSAAYELGSDTVILKVARFKTNKAGEATIAGLRRNGKAVDPISTRL